MKVTEDFLPKELFDHIKEGVFASTSNFPWYYTSSRTYNGVEGTPKDFQLSHNIYNDYTPITYFYDTIAPVIDIIHPKALIRCKINMLFKEELPLFIPEYHYDQITVEDGKEVAWDSTVAILYLDTNNGYTLFEDGSKCYSKDNRLVEFSNKISHTGVAPTNSKRRVLINFNYYK